jgi:uncharacterized protein (TIGR00369 family)
MDFRSHIDALNTAGASCLPGMMGIQVVALNEQSITCRMAIRPEMLAPNGYLHAAAVIALADTACGYGTFSRLPVNAAGFTTIELKSNFTGTARQGSLTCTAQPLHAGRLTQVWDAEVADEGSGKVIAHFRCTQMILFEALNGCLA